MSERCSSGRWIIDPKADCPICGAGSDGPCFADPDFDGAAAAEITRLRADVARLREALVAADGFVTNGIAFGFIRMPDPGTPDTAHQTPGMIRAALDTAP